MQRPAESYPFGNESVESQWVSSVSVSPELAGFYNQSSPVVHKSISGVAPGVTPGLPRGPGDPPKESGVPLLVGFLKENGSPLHFLKDP